MSLRDKVISTLQSSIEDTEARSKSMSELKMFKKAAIDIAKKLNISLSGVGSSGDFVEDVRNRAQGTVLEHLHILTGFFSMSDIFCENPLDSKIYKKYFDILETTDDPHSLLLYKVKGTGKGNTMWCMYMDYGDTPIGSPRIVVFNKDYQTMLTTMPLQRYIKEIQ